MVERKLAHRPWLVCLVAALLAGMACYPQFSTFAHPNDLLLLNWNALRAQIEHPFTPLGINANFHAGQIGRRLTVPVLAHVLHLRLEDMLLIQFAALPVFLRLVWLAIRKAAGSGLALWVTVALSSCFVSQTFWFDNIGNFDCYAYLLIAASLATRKGWLACLFFFLGMFTDERVIVMGPIIMAWHHIGLPYGRFEARFGPIRKSVWALGITLVAALALREALRPLFGLGILVGETGDVGLALILKNWQRVRYGLFFTLELGWIPVLLIPALFWRDSKMLGLDFGIYLLTAILATLSVVDQSRSVSYLFPASMLGWVAMEKKMAAGSGRTVAALAAFAGLLIPPMVVVGPMLIGPSQGYFPGTWREAANGLNAIWQGLPR